jgi:CRISPR-associated endonuclease Cas1
MAATQTVPQQSPFRNFTASSGPPSGQPNQRSLCLNPRYGVVTLYGYGIDVRVDRGHLVLSDGIASDRRQARLPKVGHGLKRLVVIGSDGMVSLAALRWLADQGAAFAMLDRDGSVLATTGPVSASDARLRRAQACVAGSEVAVPIVRELISQKLTGQEYVARKSLGDVEAADSIARYRGQLSGAETVHAISFIESQGANVYWGAWRNREVAFPKKDLARVPEHWLTFGPRHSPLSGTARCAANPANAILNYLYTVLESETCLAASALGLDPGLGLLHADRPVRDSLACDLMEPIRPKVDAYLLDWLIRTPFKREWFFEQPDGNCRLMGSFAQRLSETALTWSREVAPFVEWFAQSIWSTVPNAAGRRGPGTRLTRRRWREATNTPLPLVKALPKPQSVCVNCGAGISMGKRYCEICAETRGRESLAKGSRLGRVRALTPEARAKRGKTVKQHIEARLAWKPDNLPSWLDNEAYMTRIRPSLERFSRSAIAAALNVCLDYAGEVRAGRRIPHSRHWVPLAELAGLTNNE